MSDETAPSKPGQWVFRATVIGAFLGLLADRFVLGLIIGFFVGLALSSRERQHRGPGAADEGGTT